jgi:integrase/recombinase XerD
MNISDYLQRKYSPNTIRVYQKDLEKYLMLNPSAAHYGFKDIMSHLGLIRSKYTNKSTIRREMAAIKVYYDYLCASNQREDNPAKHIYLKDRVSTDIQLQDLLNPEELQKLIDYKPERFLGLAHRNKVILSLLIYQALRAGELEAIKVGDIDLEKYQIYISASPLSNARTLHLHASQILLFKNYIETVRPKFINKLKPLNTANHNYLIVSLRGTMMGGDELSKHIMRCYGAAFKPKKINCQTIRQSVITNLLKKGTDLRIVQSFAGHKHPSTTEKYKQTNVVQLKLALEFYHPFK